MAKAHINTPFLSGTFTCAILDNPCTDLILGCLPQLKQCTSDEIVAWEKLNAANATTRADSVKHQDTLQDERLLLLSPTGTDDTSRQKFIEQQKADTSVSPYLKLLKDKAKVTKNASWFFRLNGILTRYYTTGNHEIQQTVLPEQHRLTVLKIAHESPFAGHLAYDKTRARIQAHFYWPGFCNDIKLFCRSCNVCQQLVRKGKHPTAEVQPSTLASRPFESVAVDIVGPLNQVSSKGNRFILTMVDLCTRWVEAVALKYITSKDVANVFLHLFSRFGFPRTILSDRGTQFISAATQALTKLLGIKQHFTTAYHPASNGIVEKINGDLKHMLAKVTAENPADWDTLLPTVLFAYREIPHSSTGFSPFELVYGANPRGPLTIYHQVLTNSIEIPTPKTPYEMVTETRDKIMKSCVIAKAALERKGQIYRQYANKGARTIELEPDQDILLLLPDKRNLLLTSWQGPFKVVRRISDVDYEISINGHLKIFHVNMLKPYYTRKETEVVTDEQSAPTPSDQTTDIHNATTLVSETGSYDNGNTPSELTEYTLSTTTVLNQVDDDGMELPVPIVDKTATVDSIHIDQGLTDIQRRQLVELVTEYKDLFSDIPGRTDRIEHSILLSDSKPIKCRPYSIPLSYRENLNKEILNLEASGIIQKSTSEYSFPIVLVKKKDSTIRLCMDYRKLNNITKIDAEPIPSCENLILDMSTSKIFSKLDLTKGYWQVPMQVQSMHLTAFSTPLGLYEWRFLPFGL